MGTGGCSARRAALDCNPRPPRWRDRSPLVASASSWRHGPRRQPQTAQPPGSLRATGVTEPPRITEPPRTSQPHWTDEVPRATEPHWTSEQAWHRGSGGFTATDPSADSADWAPSGPAGQPDWEVPEPPRVAPSGLPVRQPRAARPVTPAPLSPSGSLWDPVEPDAGAGEPGYGAEAQEPGSRPIFVWNPSTPAESYPAAPRD